MIFGIHLPVDLRKEDVLIARTRRLARNGRQPRNTVRIRVGCCGVLGRGHRRQAVQLVQIHSQLAHRPACRIHVGSHTCSIGPRSRRRHRSKEIRRIAERRHPRKVPQKAIERKEEEQLVLNDRPTDTDAHLLAPVLRLKHHGVIDRRTCRGRPCLRSLCRERILRTPPSIAIKEVRLAMQCIGARPRHRIHHATRRAAILHRVVRRVHLKFQNRSLCRRVPHPRPPALLGKERLVIVLTVKLHVVQQRRLPTKAQQPKPAALHHTRRQQRIRAPPIVVHRHILQHLQPDRVRKVVGLRVHCRRLGRHLHDLAAPRRRQPRIQVRQRPHGHFHFRRGKRRKATRRHPHRVQPRLQPDCPKEPRSIRSQRLLRIRPVVPDNHRRARNHRAAAILHRAANRPIHRRLCPHHRGCQGSHRRTRPHASKRPLHARLLNATHTGGRRTAATETGDHLVTPSP